MNEYTAEDLKNELVADGLTIDGEPADRWDLWETSPGTVVNTLSLGDFVVVEAETGKSGELTYFDGDYSVWANWVILQQGDRYFRLPGEYDSWDGKGWTGEVEEVEKVKKTIEIWENKHDY